MLIGASLFTPLTPLFGLNISLTSSLTERPLLFGGLFIRFEMTNLEAIKGKLGYPLSDNAFKVALADRGLTDTGTYVKGEAFDLAYADTIVSIITHGNVSEGGFSISMAEAKTLTSLANSIYAQYGITSPLPRSTVKFAQRW